MRIAQVLLPIASEYERKSQRIDCAGLAGGHEVIVIEPDAAKESAADVVHFYGNDLAAGTIAGLRHPFIVSAAPPLGRFRLGFKRPPQPRYIVSPVAPIDPDARLQLLPEAVEDCYFAIRDSGFGMDIHRIPVIGTFAPHRPGVATMIEQTMVRLQRTRDDVRWSIFDRPPSPDDLQAVDVWVDPATSANDFDGFVAEAIAAGKVVVASRTSINSIRTENGRTGFLVPANDPNELSHAILAALFKSEAAKLKIEAAKQTVGKFRPRQRIRVLERIYETLVQ